MVGADLQTSLKQAVDIALKETDADKADQKYMDIVQLVRMQVGDNETDIANALQSVAKDLESEGRKQDAFDFKQKTCILLLELTMNPLPPLPKEFSVSIASSPVQEPLLKHAMTIHCMLDIKQGRKHYSNLLEAIVLDEGKGWICMRTAHGAQFLLVQESIKGSFPAFIGSPRQEAVEALALDGWIYENRTFETPQGKAHLYSHDLLGRLALI